jgi:hypothetical protein
MKPKKLGEKSSGQMIMLMGIILALTIFVISSLAADIINLDLVISNERSGSIIAEFNNVKETFGIALNYNLITNISNSDGTLIFQGNSSNITKIFNETRDQFFELELQYGNIFDAHLNNYWHSYLADEENVYYVDVSLTLDDGTTQISENVLYSIVCAP